MRQLAKKITGKLSRRTKILITLIALLLGFGLIIINRYTIVPKESELLAEFQRIFSINHPSEPGKINDLSDMIGHRGCGSKKYPENTWGAIEEALQMGLDTIEIDIRSDIDGNLFIFHDATLERLLQGEEGNQEISDLSLADMQEYKWKEQRFPWTKSSETETSYEKFRKDGKSELLSLEDFFGHLVADNLKEVIWVLDIKEEKLASRILTILNDHLENNKFEKDKFVLMGVFEVIKAYKGKGYPLGYVAGWGEKNNKFEFLLGHDFILQRCRSFGSEFHSLVIPAAFVKMNLIENVKHLNSEPEVWSYGAEDIESWKRLRGLGVDRLIIDNVEAAEAYPPSPSAAER